MRLLMIMVSFWMLCMAQSANAQSYNIRDFGAIPDGVTLNTEAIQKAIDKAYAKGGGKVIFPSGKFLTGNIQLKSNVELYLEEGAVLLGSTSPYDYFIAEGAEKTHSQKTDDNSALGLILAIEAKHVKISGQGTIDGQGLALALNRDSLHHAGILVDENYNYRRMRPSELVRPKLFRFLQCENVIIENITITYPGRATKGMAYIPLSDLDRVPEQIKKYPEFSMFGELPAWGFYVRHASNVVLKNIHLRLDNKDYRPAFVFDDVANLRIESPKIENAGSQAQFVLKDVVIHKIEFPAEKVSIVKKETK